MKNIFFFLIFLSLINLSSCKNNEINTRSLENGKINVFVSILPQKFFVEKIGGEKVNVQVFVKPGANPATYEPSIKQISDIANTKILFRTGVPFEESWIDKIKAQNSEMKIVDLRNGIKLREIDGFSGVNKESTTEEAKENSQNHHSKDPHIWLSPSLVEIQSNTIFEALSEEKPELKKEFANNLKNFQKELDNLDSYIRKSLENLNSRLFMVFHPSWGYFADEFGLKQIPIELEGKEPTQKKLSEIINFAKENQIKVIFIQEQFSKKQAESIAKEIGAKIIKIDPLAQNYIENMKLIADTISDGIK